MENLNAEQIIKVLECCLDFKCTDCPMNYGDCEERDFENIVKQALPILKDTFALIKSQEQKIFELENRLKECENGYEGTLVIERAKIKQLTDDNKWCAKRILEADKIINELRKNTDEIAKTLPMVKKEIQADTVREMQELLKPIFVSKEYTLYTGASIHETIDQIALEMLEGNQ